MKPENLIITFLVVFLIFFVLFRFGVAVLMLLTRFWYITLPVGIFIYMVNSKKRKNNDIINADLNPEDEIRYGAESLIEDEDNEEK